MDQQDQTLKYFSASAADWQRKATPLAGKYNLIESRNSTVLATINSLPSCRSLLDVGCGTGQLVIEAARKGIDAHGVDFASEMISQCQANMGSSEIPAKFTCASFFDLPAEPNSYDVISAHGFIEYLSLAETDLFFGRARAMLKPNGAIVVGSRNRLYNAVSMNAFTLIERDLGTLDSLAAEAVILQSATSQADAISALAKVAKSYPKPDAHPDTGIGVSLRYQFSPGELIDGLRRHGFTTRTIYPVHFHGLPLVLKKEHPALHHELAQFFQKIAPLDQRIVPFCSSFVIDARRPQ